MKTIADWQLILVAAVLFAIAGAIDLASNDFDFGTALQFGAAFCFLMAALHRRPKR